VVVITFGGEEEGDFDASFNVFTLSCDGGGAPEGDLDLAFTAVFDEPKVSVDGIVLVLRTALEVRVIT
jgi:hypothetical protein